MKKELLFDFSRQNARNAQHVQFVTDVLAAIPQETAQECNFAAQYADFLKAVEDELQCFQPNKGYLETSEIVAADAARDRRFNFYKQVVSAYADYHFDAEKQKAGATLAFLFREAGRVAYADYASETALLSDLVGRLRMEPNAAALSTIGLEEAPDELERANTAFNDIYLKRSAEERVRAQSWTMKELRMKADSAFNELAKTINALYAVNELVTKAEDTGITLAKLIDDVNAIVIRLKKTIGSKNGNLLSDTGSGSAGGGDDSGESPDPIV